MIKRNLIANYLGMGWSGLMGLAFIPLYIQYLGVESYGLIGLFAVLQTWLSLLDLGMSPTLGREMARFTAGAHSAQSIRNLLRSLETVVFSLAALITIVLWASAEWLASDWLTAERLSVQDVANALTVTSIVIGLRFCEGIYRSGILGLQHHVWFNTANAVLSTVRHGGVILVLAYVSPTISAFFLWHGVISVVTVLAYSLKLNELLPKAPQKVCFSTQALRDVWKFAGGMLAINLLAIMLTQIDKLLLTRLLRLEEYGYYTLAVTVAGGLYLLITPITQTFYPKLVELVAQDKQTELASIYHQAAQLITVVTAPIMAVLLLLPTGVIYVWSGDVQLAAQTAPLLAPLAFGTFLNGLMWLPAQAQLAHGWTTLGFKINLVAVCLLVPAILWLVPIYGAIASAWIWVALNTGYTLFGIHFMHLRILLGEKRAWYIEDLIWPTATALGLVYFIVQLITVNTQDKRWSLMLLIVLMWVFASAGALLSARRTREMLNQQVRSAFKAT